MFKVPEQHRIKTGHMGSTPDYGNNGYFVIPFESFLFDVIASDGMDWEHVSVSLPNRTPNWKEMCFIKDLFWGEDECVVQYHPPKSEYVNNHNFCLHLWKSNKIKIPLPPSILVGLKNVTKK